MIKKVESSLLIRSPDLSGEECVFLTIENSSTFSTHPLPPTSATLSTGLVRGETRRGNPPPKKEGPRKVSFR